MAETQITTPNQGSLTKYTQEDLLAVTSAGKWLPYLQVQGAGSELVKSQQFTMGNLSLIYDKNRIIDLGKEVDVFVTSMRPRAMQFGGAQPVSYFNRHNPEFKKIVQKADIKDSGCMFGLEFLIWIPKEKTYASLFMGNKSGRREAPNLLNLMNTNPNKSEPPIYDKATPMTLKATYVPKSDKNKYSWHMITATACSTPLEPLPNPEETQEIVDSFNNPPESQVEIVEETGEQSERER